MSPAETSTNLSSQILRPVYALFTEQPEKLLSLQQRFSLPSLENIGEERERLATGQIVAVLKELALVQGYRDIGLTIGSGVTVGCFGSLSFLLLSCASFREMLDCLCRYHQAISLLSLPPRWFQSGSEFYLELRPDPGAGEISTVRNDLMLAVANRLIQHAAGGLYQPERVHICGDGGGYIARYSECLGTDNLTFNCDSLRLYGSSVLLDKVLPNANPSLCKVFSKELDMLLRALSKEQTVVDQIQLILACADNLADISLGGVAKELQLGERTLARQLADYGVSFRELLANYKSTRAIRLLAEGKTVEDVSHYLGFSERAAFDRAFKKWQGITASRFQSDYKYSGVCEIDVFDSTELPGLPVVANELLKMLNEDRYDMDQLAALVERDPPITARLLAIASSAAYGMDNITTIKAAIVRVFGVDMLRNLALAMLANDCLDTSRCSEFSLKHYWVKALATGQLAADLAKFVPSVNPSEAYLLGLLHNIGGLLLAQRYPDAMSELLQHEGLKGAGLAEVCALEEDVLGVDACSAGAALAAFWQFPRYLSASLRALVDPDYGGEHSQLVMLVVAAESKVRLLLKGNDPLVARSSVSGLIGSGEGQLVEVLDAFQFKLENIKAVAEGLA